MVTSTGQPVSTSSGNRRVASSECRLFLPKSWPGIDQDRLAGALQARLGPLGESDHRRCGCHQRRRHRRPDAGGCAAATMARMRTHYSGAEFGSHLCELGLSAAPRVVQQVSALLSATARPTSARQVSTEITTSADAAYAYAGDESGHPAQLLRGVDDDPRRGLDPADVEDLGAPSAMERSAASRASASPYVRSAVEERVWGAVNDRHHGHLGRGDGDGCQAADPRHYSSRHDLRTLILRLWMRGLAHRACH